MRRDLERRVDALASRLDGWTESLPTPDELLYLLGLERRRSTGASLASGLGWLALGGAIGGGLALLLAPRSGRETREELKREAQARLPDA